uniref:ATP synthase F0 subunit 8 n=1 Tax=Seasogonia rosea TaxID=3004257 RepID=A0A9E9FX17_9HEMI|nr:ATP synthase F0 subunit 8 [Seasogonia rosea]WAP91739.1 ATP synthase F0 subunit 8 [Seasogonia rosea]
MPQMSPMWWMSLMLFFILSIMLMMSLLYFLPLNKSFHHKHSNFKLLIWKW